VELPVEALHEARRSCYASPIPYAASSSSLKIWSRECERSLAKNHFTLVRTMREVCQNYVTKFGVSVQRAVSYAREMFVWKSIDQRWGAFPSLTESAAGAVALNSISC
jgi:hypothetical protein